MSKRAKSIVVTEAEWVDAVKIARILRHRTISNEWRIRHVAALAPSLLGCHEQADEIRTRMIKP